MVVTAQLQPTEGDRIIVVEQSATSFIASILRLKGYLVTHIQSGAVALTHILEEPPALIVSKVLTITNTSMAFSEHIRETPQIPYIPILLIASSDDEDLVQCLDSGADDFLRHPVETDELLARVRSLLRLKRTFDERERVTKIREDLLSRLTHDLRTPLVAADRMYDRLCQGKYGPLAPAALQILQAMQENNQELLTMTNTLLSIYRYESGSKSLSFTDFDLKELIDSVIAELEPLAEEKAIALTFTASSGLPEGDPLCDWIIDGVKVELRNAFINLIGNALKFTDQGLVHIDLNRARQGYDVRIQDSGAGIHPEELPQIFDRFYQGQHSRSGSGLGLNLVRQIILAHQGNIDATSVLGEGTCFTLWFPRRQNRSVNSAKR